MRTPLTILLCVLITSLHAQNAYIQVESESGISMFLDSRDGKVYKTVQIGNQVWMAENLVYKPSFGNYWAYGNNNANVAVYGYLYDWETAKKVCPSGWHLPTDSEWKALEMHLGMSQAEADDTGWRGDNEGGKLKETGTTHWKSSNTGATNESGFTALPGGIRHGNGNFYYVGGYGFWWSATESNTKEAWCRVVYYIDSIVDRFDLPKDYGFSVRCLRD